MDTNFPVMEISIDIQEICLLFHHFLGGSITEAWRVRQKAKPPMIYIYIYRYRGWPFQIILRKRGSVWYNKRPGRNVQNQK